MFFQIYGSCNLKTTHLMSVFVNAVPHIALFQVMRNLFLMPFLFVSCLMFSVLLMAYLYFFYSDPAVPANQQPKKRRRKDVTKGQGGNADANNPNKHVKIGNKGRKASSLIERNSTSQSHILAEANVHSSVVLEASPKNATETSLKKKTADSQVTMDPLGLSNVDATRQDKDADQQKSGVLLSQSHNNKLKESSEFQDDCPQRSNDKSSHFSKCHLGKQLNTADELDQSIQRKEKAALVERFDLNVPASRASLQTTVSNSCIWPLLQFLKCLHEIFMRSCCKLIVI